MKARLHPLMCPALVCQVRHETCVSKTLGSSMHQLMKGRIIFLTDAFMLSS